MRIRLHGPGIDRYSEFIVHAADCRDNARVPGSDGGFDLDVASRREAVKIMYDGQLKEGAAYASCRDEFYFEPCLRDLPEEVEL